MYKNLVKILKDFYNKYQNEPWVISDDELTKKSNKKFFVRDYRFKISIFSADWVGGEYWKNYTFCFAVSTDGDYGTIIFVVFPKKIDMVIITSTIQENMIDYKKGSRNLWASNYVSEDNHYNKTFNETGEEILADQFGYRWGIRDLREVFYKINIEGEHNIITIRSMYPKQKWKTLEDEIIQLSTYENNETKRKFYSIGFSYLRFSLYFNANIYNLFLEIHKEVLKEKNKEIENKLKPLLDEFDKNGNGTVDILEGGDDFMKLVRKHQKKIIDVDKNHLQSYVKLSNYLSSKRENIQLIFENLSKSSEIKELEQTKKMLKYQIHIYELQLSMGILMIVSLIDDDHITYFEIYECFAKLDVFNSKWQNDIYKKLTSIDTGIYDLMISIQEFEESMVAQIRRLTNISSDSISNLKDVVTKELKGINSGMEFNNLLGVINTYQNYKTRKILEK